MCAHTHTGWYCAVLTPVAHMLHYLHAASGYCWSVLQHTKQQVAHEAGHALANHAAEMTLFGWLQELLWILAVTGIMPLAGYGLARVASVYGIGKTATAAASRKLTLLCTV
jgi:hypothetical protein